MKPDIEISPPMTDAERFKTLRLQLGLSQRDAAALVGIGGPFRDRSVRRWESGERRVDPSAIRLLEICDQNAPTYWLARRLANLD